MNLSEEQAELFVRLFLDEILAERRVTRSVIAAIPDQHRSYRPDEKSRSAFELAWHLIQSERWFLQSILQGDFSAGEKELPAGIDTVTDLLRWDEEHFHPLWAAVLQLCSAAFTEPLDMFGVLTQPRVLYLQLMLKHSIHHRGQLAAYLRPMGGKVPSIYGESADTPAAMR